MSQYWDRRPNTCAGSVSHHSVPVGEGPGGKGLQWECLRVTVRMCTGVGENGWMWCEHEHGELLQRKTGARKTRTITSKLNRTYPCRLCNVQWPGSSRTPVAQNWGKDTPGGTGDQSAKRTCDICKAVWPQLPTTMSTPASQATNPHKHDAGNVEIDVQKHHTRALAIL